MIIGLNDVFEVNILLDDILHVRFLEFWFIFLIW